MKALVYEWALRLIKLGIGTYLVLLGAVALTLCAEDARAQDGSPATPVPADRWGSLAPLSILADTTGYQFNFEPGCKEPFYFDVELAGGRLLAATGSSLEVWDARATPNRPSKVAVACMPTLAQWRKSDKDFYLTSVEALGELAVAGLEGGMGVQVFRLLSNNSLQLLYQHEGVCSGCLSVRDVALLEVEPAPGAPLSSFALVADDSLGVYAYRIDAAGALATPCLDSPEGTCPGVYLGRLSGGASSMWVQTLFRIAGEGGWIATRWQQQMQVWRVGPALLNQGAPQLVYAYGPNPLDVELWMSGNAIITAAATGQQVVISRNGITVAILDTPGGAISPTARSVTDTLSLSKTKGQAWLYAGSTRVGGAGLQHEYLYDVTDLDHIEEVTPKVGCPPPACPSNAGYWGWYYQDNPTGFRNVAPYAGVVDGSRFYRAAWSLFDAHNIDREATPPPPEVVTFCDFEVHQ